MEKTTRSSRKASRKPSDENIKKAYINYLLTHGKQPPSVFKFCLDLGIKENEFYSMAGSFEALERTIWNDFIENTIKKLNADKQFQSFSSREKILTFYYALLEELRSNRSYVLLSLKGYPKLEIVPAFLTSFKQTFIRFIESVLNDGKASGEIANRPYIEKGYPELFWIHMGFILLFWTKDSSAAFERTDTAIEKSVNLSFDLIGKGAVDSALDFIKFLYQTTRN